jgi:hypothetical protein
MDKNKSAETIDAVVALVRGLDRAILNEGKLLDYEPMISI